MPGDNYKRVHAGERLQIPAAAWNDLLAMLAEWKRDGFVQRTPGPELSKAPVKVRNATGGALGQFSVVKVNGVTIDPDDNEEGFRRQVCLEGATPDAADNVVAILQRAAADGEVVPAVMTGESVALVNVSSAAHQYAAPENGETVLVSQAAAGPWRILWANGTGDDTWCVVRSEGSAATSLTVKESDGNPTATSVQTVKIAQSSGLYMTDDGSNTVTIGASAATKTTSGVISTSAQTLGNGEKTFVGGVYMATDGSNVPCVFLTGASSGTDYFSDGDTRYARLYAWNGLTYKNSICIQAGGLALENGVYAIGSTVGLNTTITIPKLTSGGANGSITVSGGIVTGYTAPT